MKLALQAPLIITTLLPQLNGTSRPATWRWVDKTLWPYQVHQPFQPLLPSLKYLQYLDKIWPSSSRLPILILACLKRLSMLWLILLTLNTIHLYQMPSEKAPTATTWTNTFIGRILTVLMSTCQAILKSPLEARSTPFLCRLSSVIPSGTRGTTVTFSSLVYTPQIRIQSALVTPSSVLSYPYSTSITIRLA